MSCRLLLPIQSLITSLEWSIGKGKGRVPWTELQRAQDDYIEAEYLPETVTLKQYYHLRQEDVQELLNHWTKRQAAGEVPFDFKKEVYPARRNRRTLDADTDMDMQPNDGTQEDSQNDHDGQAHSGSNSSTMNALPGNGVGNAAENPNGVSRLVPKYAVAIAGANLFELVCSLHLTCPRMAKRLPSLVQLPMYLSTHK